MLARVNPAGRISVRVNGAQIPSDQNLLDKNPDKDRFSSVEWATTITWRNGATRDHASSSVEPQLVHVVRVKDDPGKEESTDNHTKIHIRTAIRDGDFCKDTLMVGSPVNNVIKGEDERSSSGASSAPGSDCEKSDSDREVDDSNDSGFCLSGRHPHSNHSFITFDNSTKPRNKIRLTISSYSDPKHWDNGNLQFHVRDFPLSFTDTDDIETRIDASHALLCGSSRLQNRIRSSIVSLVQSSANRNYFFEEKGRVVLYTTSVGVVRSTSERCFAIKKILGILMIRFEEKDVFMNKDFQRELKERLGMQHVILPQVFMEGKHLGGADVIEHLNEIGELRELLHPYKRHSIESPCSLCGGYRFFNCPSCGGSKKSRNMCFSLNCVQCNENGLVRCPHCMFGN